VAFSKDGHYVVSASVDKVVKVWEITSREVTSTSEHGGEVVALAVSPNGKYLASGGADHTIKIWDLKKGTELHTLTGHSATVKSLIFTPDSNFLVSGSGDNVSKDNSVRVWDVATGKQVVIKGKVPEYASLVNYVPALGLSKDGKKIMVWLPGPNRPKSYSTVQVFNRETGEKVLTVVDQGRNVKCLTFSPDGSRAAFGAEDGSVRIYNLDKKGEREPGGDWPVSQKGVGDLVFTPDGTKLITGSASGQIKIWKVSDHKTPLHTLKDAHAKGIGALAMSADGKRFASLGFDNVVKLWDVEKGTVLRKWEFKLPLQDGNTLVRNMTFAPKGKFLVTANADTTLYLLALPE
jgi:WD40 repeat protein